MARYKLKQPEFEAVIFNGLGSVEDLLTLSHRGKRIDYTIDSKCGQVTLDTSAGPLTLHHGDYLVRDEDGSLCVVAGDSFKRIYEASK